MSKMTINAIGKHVDTTRDGNKTDQILEDASFRGTFNKTSQKMYLFL